MRQCLLSVGGRHGERSKWWPSLCVSTAQSVCSQEASCMLLVITMYSPEYNLEEFRATDRGLFGVWISSEGVTIVMRTVVGVVEWDATTT